MKNQDHDSQHRGIGQWLLARFNRVTTSGKFISEIDGLRFIAIGTVILFHVAVNLAIKSPDAYGAQRMGTVIWDIARFGFHGVELFFVISGFILASPFAAHRLLGKPKVNLKQYFLRRVTRLEPPYMICMIFFFFVAVYVKGGDIATLLPHLGASLIYLHNLIYGSESLINNVAWSLEIEIQFYLLVPILAGLFAIRKTAVRRSVIAGIILLSITHQWLFIGEGSWMYLSIIRFIHFFLLGFLLADLYLLDWKEHPKHTWGWDIVSVVGWPLLFLIWNSPGLSRAILPYGHEPVIAIYAFPILTFLLYNAVFRGPLTNKIMTNPWITTIGGMCYTIYLFHNQFIGAILILTKGLVPTADYTVNYFVQAVIVIPVMLAATSVYFLLIERPCMRKDWPRRFADRVKGVFGRRPARVASPAPERP